MESLKIRIPTTEEWDKLMDITQENNSITNWKDMFSWINDSDFPTYPAYRVVRGCYSPRCRDWCSASYQCVRLGFRPAFEPLESETRFSRVQDGEVVPIGTLYMDGKPVHVPESPKWNGDIEDYVHGAELTFRPPLDDPAYVVHAIKTGGVFIADRNLLKMISYVDIAASIKKPVIPKKGNSRVLVEEKQILHITVTPDRQDGLYDRCMWAKFIIDPEDMNLTIRSDGGNLSYTWQSIGDNTPRGFINFLCGLNEEYLLCKLSEQTQFNFEKTRKSLMVCRAAFPEIVEALQNAEPFGNEHDFAAWYMRLPDTHSDDLEAIVMDYPAGHRAAMEVFTKYVQPKLKEML